MFIEKELESRIREIFRNGFGSELNASQLVFQPTRKEFTGDITCVVFGLSKAAGKSPEATATHIGTELMKEPALVTGFEVVKGFLNITINNNLFINELDVYDKKLPKNGTATVPGKPFLVEYSSPNTNKPLHLGHMRNILLGHAVSEILKANGHPVRKVNVVNDRGIHICKSMLAWKKFGNGDTPAITGEKGDHLVGRYYVEFDKHYREEQKELRAKGYSLEEAEKNAPILLEAQSMLRDWEAGEPETIRLWETMNNWVYEGFDHTYHRLGISFDQIDYESQTYLLGKEIVLKGLADGILYRKPDGSVWVDLRADGLDEKVLLRSDGTSVYMTQDIGTAVKRYQEFGFEKMIYVVGNEQDYHFKVLFLILRKLGYEWAGSLYHLSYNMVDLPSGKMKSREGTVVDADELLDEMIAEARRLTTELGKLDNKEGPEAQELFSMLGLGALKYFILKVDPEKRMLFNPNESIDFNGNTGPFIQYTYARLCSVMRKARTVHGLEGFEHHSASGYEGMLPKEKEIIRILIRYPGVVHEAGERFSPALVANYVYELAKTYNQFYHDHIIADSSDAPRSLFRLVLCRHCASVIRASMNLLGIHVPDRM